MPSCLFVLFSNFARHFKNLAEQCSVKPLKIAIDIKKLFFFIKNQKKFLLDFSSENFSTFCLKSKKKERKKSFFWLVPNFSPNRNQREWIIIPIKNILGILTDRNQPFDKLFFWLVILKKTLEIWFSLLY